MVALHAHATLLFLPLRPEKLQGLVPVPLASIEWRKMFYKSDKESKNKSYINTFADCAGNNCSWRKEVGLREFSKRKSCYEFMKTFSRFRLPPRLTPPNCEGNIPSVNYSSTTVFVYIIK
jgi:hypothetical protein